MSGAVRGGRSAAGTPPPQSTRQLLLRDTFFQRFGRGSTAAQAQTPASEDEVFVDRISRGRASTMLGVVEGSEPETARKRLLGQ